MRKIHVMNPQLLRKLYYNGYLGWENLDKKKIRVKDLQICGMGCNFC